jgi:pulmonary surfactant-associated protein D
LNDRAEEGVFVWVSSEKTASDVYMNWDEDEPSVPGDNEDCVEIFSWGKWNDRDCSTVLDYICEKESISM